MNATNKRKRPPRSRHKKTQNKAVLARSFREFNWSNEKIPEILENLKFLVPTEIQAKTIPLALEGKNVIGQSKTGTGKTLAFVAPSLDKVDTSKKGVQVLAITPTRELCLQVASVFKSVGEPLGIKTIEVYGGVDIERQKNALRSGDYAVVTATPGRLIDLFKRRYMKFGDIKVAILDEADRMLDMGFMPDVEYIFRQINRDKAQLMLFSATIFQEIMDSINVITRGNHTIIRIGRNEDEFVIKEIEQEKYEIHDRNDKFNLLVKILKKEKPRHMIIFVNTITGVEYLERRLKERFPKMAILGISGNVSQKRREKILEQFKTHKINTLIATDVASRGLDIPNISHVINYDVPEYPENYVHRIGRTGRKDKKAGGKTNRGKAITICTMDDLIYMQRIEQLIQKTIPARSFGDEFQPRHPFLR